MNSRRTGKVSSALVVLSFKDRYFFCEKTHTHNSFSRCLTREIIELTLNLDYVQSKAVMQLKQYEVCNMCSTIETNNAM